MKISLAIKNRWTGKVIFEFETENNTIAKTVNEYVRIADADLTDADLTDADLTDANLTDANLTRADLTDANLTRANLTRADLTDANLTDANLTVFKNDLWRVLLQNKTEIEGLKRALIEGRINGTKYQGKCACLKGTIANIKGCTTKEAGLIENVNEPSEGWFLQIKEGQTHNNSGVVKLTLEWISEFEELLNK